MGCRRPDWLSEYQRSSLQGLPRKLLACQAQLRLGKRDHPSPPPSPAITTPPRGAGGGGGGGGPGGARDNHFGESASSGRPPQCADRGLNANSDLTPDTAGPL